MAWGATAPGAGLAPRVEVVTTEPDHGMPGPGIEGLYPTEDLAGVQAWARRVVLDSAELGGAGAPAPGTADRGSRGLAAGMLAAGLMGLADVLEGRDHHHEVIEQVRHDETDEPVTFHHVPGDPQASQIIIRPWLLGD